MCGRFTTTVDLEEIKRYFKIGAVEGEYQPLYNASPGQDIPVILGQSRTLAFYRWGLIPFWAKDKTIGSKLINARSETLEEKPSFRHAFIKRRCLIPADGFYEWKKEGKNKIPYRITMTDQTPFAMAGLWESWSPEPEVTIYSCSIITLQANSLLQPLHDRMPAILPPGDMSHWLDPDLKKPQVLKELLKPYPSRDMTLYPVSTLVNSPANNSPLVIEPLNAS